MTAFFRGPKTFIFPSLYIFPPQPAEDLSMPRCVNIKSLKFQGEQCSYKATKGEFCARHSKNPKRYKIPDIPIIRPILASVKRIQKIWRFRHGLKLARERTPAFFIRSLCHNDSELASFEPLNTIPRAYFFAIRDSSRIWGFDIRTLVIQYEQDGKLENPYTKEQCSPETVEQFRKHVENLRRWKMPTHYTNITDLTPKQSWNLRVLDMCLRLDMLGYRIATKWFIDIDLTQQKRLYNALYHIWYEQDEISDSLRETIVPGSSTEQGKLFKWSPDTILVKNDMDSVRRTNLNVIERLISSASQQSDRTLGAMYSVMALSKVSYRCRSAYPWLL